MRSLFASSLLLLLATSALAQQPATAAATAAAAPGKLTPLDGIVAVVGDQIITRYDLTTRELQMQQSGELKAPTDDSTRHLADSTVLEEMLEEELLIQKASDLKVTVEDGDVTPAVDQQVKSTRAKFSTESEYRTALVQAGLGSPEDYRRFLMDELRRQMTLQRVIKKLRDDNKIVPVSVTDAEVQAEYQRTKDYLPKKPAAVTFKQIIIAPQPSEAAKTVARVRAESLLAELQHGADFEKLAKRESMDPVTKETGGDLGWMRRGNQFPEFDRWLFGASFLAPLAPGQISPVFETPYGFHIVRVDRVQPGEVRARQILIVPKIDSTDIAKTAKLADSVAKMWKAGVPFDTLAKKYHDFAGQEETSILTPFPRDSLPMPYQLALAGKSVGDFAVFRIPGSSVRPEVPKFVVAQLLSVDEGGNQTLGELKEAIRSDLAQRGGTRRYVDGLRKQTFVSVRLDAPSSVAAKPKSAP